MSDGDLGDARGTACSAAQVRRKRPRQTSRIMWTRVGSLSSYAGHAIGDDTRADLLYVMGLADRGGRHSSGRGRPAIPSGQPWTKSLVPRSKVSTPTDSRDGTAAGKDSAADCELHRTCLPRRDPPGSYPICFSHTRGTGGISLSWARGVCGRWPNSMAASPLSCDRY